MTSQSCTLIQSQLPLHAGGELESDEATVVAEHLAHCAACRALADEQSRQRERLAAAHAPVPEHVPSVWPAVRAALEREGLLARPAAQSAPLAAPASAAAPAARELERATSVSASPAHPTFTREAALAGPASTAVRASLPRAWRAWSALSAVAAALIAFAMLRPDERPAPIEPIALGAPAEVPSATLAARESAPLGGLRRLAPSEPTLAELPAGAAFAPNLLPIEPADAGATLATDRRLR